ncbi:MAG: hypothetical protein ACTHQ3_12805 [Motilibacteraceae bacterium]
MDEGDVRAWTLNGSTGAPLRGTGAPRHLKAAMKYEIVPCAPDEGDEPWRVSTRAYMFALLDRDEAELWAWHWHPDGGSSHTLPHQHVGTPVLAPDGPLTHRTHVPCGRTSFEEVVKFAIELGAQPRRPDWQNVLALTEAPFLLYRSWAARPNERSSGR